MRVACCVLASVMLIGLLSGCSDDKPAATGDQARSEAILKKDCADPRWRKQNLGLWYSVCRKPLSW